MKIGKITILTCGLLIFSVEAKADFWSSIAGGIIANNVTGSSGSASYPNEIKERMDDVNLYLWNMHKAKNYDKSYKFYLDWLENQIDKSGFDDISHLDTIAWVYKDNGNKNKALEIYHNRILPWVKVKYKPKDKDFRDKWEAYYKNISK